MKILKSIFTIILISNLIVSCTAESINDDEDNTVIENFQATGGDQTSTDETEKDGD